MPKAKPENVLPREFYDSLLSKSARRRKPNASTCFPPLFVVERPACSKYPIIVRHLFPLEEVPGVISLLAGKPNASTFPFTSLSFTARSPTDPSDNQQFSLTEPELNEGLQYGMVEGQTRFNRWLAELQEMEHKRRYDLGEGGENWRLCVTTGSQDGLYKVCDDPESCGGVTDDLRALIDDTRACKSRRSCGRGVFRICVSLHYTYLSESTLTQDILCTCDGQRVVGVSYPSLTLWSAR